MSFWSYILKDIWFPSKGEGLDPQLTLSFGWDPQCRSRAVTPGMPESYLFFKAVKKSVYG